MSSNVRISIDRILESLQKTGKHQIIQGSILCLTNLPVAFHLFSFVFTAPPVGHQCEHDAVPGGDNTTEYSACSIVVSNLTTNVSRTYECQSWKFKTNKQHSIVSEWNLVCDDVVWGRLPQSLFIVGQGIGAMMFSNLSDKFGRYPFLIVAQILTAAAGLGLAFSPNIIAYNILRLFNGIFQQGLVVIGITLLLENYPRSLRVEVATMYALVWSASCMLLALLAYLFRHLTWKIQQLAYTSVSLTLFFQAFLLKESIRWLVANKKFQRAMDIIKLVVRRNRLEMSSVDLQGIDERVKLQQTDELTNNVVVCPEIETKDTDNYNCLDLFRTWFVFRTSILIWVTWFVDSLTYFSLYLTASSIADNPFLNFFLNSLAELPSGPLFYFVGKRFGRRRFFMIFHILAGVCLLVSTCIRTFIVDGTGSTTATIIAFVGKVGTTACFNGLFVYAPEVYPTNMRTVGFGAGSTAGRVGGAFSPFIQILATAIPWAPGALFGVLCLIVAVFNYFLPESEGHELPQTTLEMKEWKRTSTIPGRSI